MRVIRDAPPATVRQTHAQVDDQERMETLGRAGVMLRCYTPAHAPAEVWAPRWSVQLVDEWIELRGRAFEGTDAVGEDVLKRVVRYVNRTYDLEFARACVAVLRLGELEHVEAMLRERKDLVMP